MTLRDDLIAAKALIDTPEKWKKGGWGNPGQAQCALGAIKCACDLNVLEVVSRHQPQTAALVAVLPHGFRTVVAFNDHPDTTHADVMALFDRAIEAA